MENNRRIFTIGGGTGTSLIIIATVILSVLKVTGKLAIGWLWVFSPIWLSIIVPFIGWIVFLIIVVLFTLIFSDSKYKS